MPTEIVIDRPRDEAERLVAAAMGHTDGIVDVTIEDDVVAGRTRGGLTGQGETVNVYLRAEAQPGAATTLSVWAEGDSGLLASDPWKYKNGFLEELDALGGRPTTDLPPIPERSRGDHESGIDAPSPRPVNKNALVWTGAAKFLTIVLVFMLLVVAVVVAIALL